MVGLLHRYGHFFFMNNSDVLITKLSSKCSAAQSYKPIVYVLFIGLFIKMSTGP